MLIDSSNGMTQRKISRQLQQNESAITATVARLIAGGFVRKKKSKEDSRVWILTLTKKGLTTLEQSGKLFAQINSLLDGAIGKQRSGELARILTAISSISTS